MKDGNSLSFLYVYRLFMSASMVPKCWTTRVPTVTALDSSFVNRSWSTKRTRSTTYHSAIVSRRIVNSRPPYHPRSRSADLYPMGLIFETHCSNLPYQRYLRSCCSGGNNRFTEDHRCIREVQGNGYRPLRPSSIIDRQGKKFCK